MAATYEPIATTTLSSAASSITFNSIASSWTDLRLVVTGTSATSGDSYNLRFNSDTSSVYSGTILSGYGSSAVSTRETNQGQMPIGNYFTGLSTSVPFFIATDIFSYAGSTYKTVLSETSLDKNGSGEVNRSVGLWRSTSAITTVQAVIIGTGFASGTTATLYGIKAA